MFDIEEFGQRVVVLLKKEFEGNFNVVFPMWNSATNVFRILPGKLPKGDLVDSVSYGGKCGPWVYPVYGMTITSPTKQKTFLIGDRTTLDEYSIRNALAYQVYETIYDAVVSGAKPEWECYNLVRPRGAQFDPLHRPVFRRPGILYLSFVEVVDHPQKGEINPSLPSILVMQQTAGQTLVQAARTAFGYGKDIVKSVDGALVNIRPSGLQPSDSGYRVLCSERTSFGFAVDVLSEPSSHPVDKEKLDFIRPWGELLHFADSEEQKKIFKEMLPKDVVAYIFNEPQENQDLSFFDDIPFDVPNANDKAVESDAEKIRELINKALENFNK